MAGAVAGIVSDLWRFPVKSLAGERVRRAFLGPFGIIGDRRHAILEEDGTVLTARRAHDLLAFAARYEDGEAAERLSVTTATGMDLDVDDPGLARELSELVGRPLTITRSAVGVHDAAAVHLVTTASVAAVGDWTGGDEVDRRRFRANVVVELDPPEPFAEAGWIGRSLELGPGGPVIEVISPTERCVMTTFDPDTLERDNRVLAGLARERDNFFGVYARVARTGWIAVGATIRQMPGDGPSA